MKKLYLLLFVLTAFTATAQNLTQKDLLGKWHLKAATMHGVLINFETGKVTPLEGYEGTYTPEKLKKVEDGIKGEHPFPVTFNFLTAGKLEVTAAGEVITEDYKLTQKEGKHYIHEGEGEMQVNIADGEMHLFVEDGDTGIEMVYKR